jgi:phage protein D
VTTTARRTTLEVTWQGTDISRDLAPSLVNAGYADNLTGAADDFTLDLEDRAGLWSGPWRPQSGDSVVARLKTATPGWLTGLSDVRLGKFAHDKISISGPPKKVSLSCVSAPLATGLRRRKRTRTWSGVTLKRIAQDIADRAELTLAWDGDAGLKYDRCRQADKSDLEFLEELCKQVGRNLKVTEDQVAVFDELARDEAGSVGEISLTGGHVLSWTFDSDDSARYGSCVITFYDPRTGKEQRGQFPPDGKTIAGLDPNGQTLEIRMAVDSIGHAQARAKALLRNANRFATSGRLSVVGDVGLVAGVTFDLTEAFGFEGKFIITKAEHRPVGGYTCELAVRRCLEGY